MHDVRNAFTTTSQPAPHKRAPGSVTNKSRITNGRWLLAGVDNRSPQGRRFRDLCNAFEAETGGRLTESEKGLIRQAAAMSLKAEALQASIVKGEIVSADEVIRLTSEARRLLEAIGAKARRKPVDASDTLDRYLAADAAADSVAS